MFFDRVHLTMSWEFREQCYVTSCRFESSDIYLNFDLLLLLLLLLLSEIDLQVKGNDLLLSVICWACVGGKVSVTAWPPLRNAFTFLRILQISIFSSTCGPSWPTTDPQAALSWAPWRYLRFACQVVTCVRQARQVEPVVSHKSVSCSGCPLTVSPTQCPWHRLLCVV